ncbi:hypothetical protein CLOSYM_02242 [[Clostridium] symbiosum ATCC 14940]|uniref:Secreted protein n=1 Tax=[Clostridium] symbiosum ATCC 14940 TaxID=411472 RepID=A0ABC9TY55_CLOSY|nr:hypothetical protein CLOSYM_02242 [[Clostridium] symbiosum ATCC 14940]
MFSLLLPFVFIILYPNYFSDRSSCICRKVYFELYHIPGYIKTISRTLIVSCVTVQPLANATNDAQKRLKAPFRAA